MDKKFIERLMRLITAIELVLLPIYFVVNFYSFSKSGHFFSGSHIITAIMLFLSSTLALLAIVKEKRKEQPYMLSLVMFYTTGIITFIIGIWELLFYFI